MKKFINQIGIELMHLREIKRNQFINAIRAAYKANLW